MRLFYILLIILCSSNVYAQKKDSVRYKKSNKILKKAIIPTSLIVGGSLMSRSTFETDFQNDIRKGIGKNVNTRLDDYFRFGPMTEMAIANALGLKAKNHWFDQAKNLFIIDLANFVVIRSLKAITEKPRPNNKYIYTSFPSGHTALVFSNAAMLHYEYKDYHPVFAHSGYAFALATASLRVLNDRHWVSDVLVGAGIGVLITHLVYAIEPLKNWNPFKKEYKISFSPMINGNEFRLSLHWNF